MRKILSTFMVLVLLLGFCLPFVPFVVYYTLPAPFVGGLLFAFLFSLISIEKLYAMIFRMPQKNLLAADRDWTAVAVGLSYTATMYAVVLEFFLYRQGSQFLSVTLFGLLVYAAAVGLRYWSFSHLGRQWAVHLDQADGVGQRNLIRTGPYGLIRHPLYLGACLECLAVPLIFNSFWALTLGLVTFIPLEIKRARFEEKLLHTTFGSEYERYAREVNGFIPRPRLNKQGLK